MLLLFLLLLDTIIVPQQHSSSCFFSTQLLLLFNIIPILVFQRHSSSYSFSTFLLFLLDATPTPQHHSYFSYCKYLSTPHQCCCFSFQHCYHSSCFRLVFPPLHVFASVGGISVSNSTCLLQTRFEGEFVFFFPNVCFLMILFLVLIVYVFLDNVD